MPTAIITGCAQGIGRAIAQRLAHDGYDLCLNDIAPQQAGLDALALELRARGRKVLVHACDVSDRASVDAMVAASVAALGPLNTMVANAGIAQVKPLLSLTEADVERMFRINVFGVHNCYAAAATQMIAQGKLPAHTPTPLANPSDIPQAKASVYKIIGAASIVAFKPFPLLSHYSASKWAVRGLTQAFAMEMAVHGITVNAYCPGIVGTKMWELIDEGIGHLQGAERGAVLKKYSDELIALGRTSVPEDVANTVHFLASADSDYMTGQNIVCDGGIVFT